MSLVHSKLIARLVASGICAALFGLSSFIADAASDGNEYAGGYRFKYYAVTHEGAEEEYGGSGVIFISSSAFGFGTNPELRQSELVSELVRGDRFVEYALEHDRLSACIATLPAEHSTAAFPLLMKPFALSRAGVSDEGVHIGFISGIDSAFDLSAEIIDDRLVGARRGYHVYFGFSADRLELEPDPEITLAACVDYAEEKAGYANLVRKASDPLWAEHVDRLTQSEFWADFEKRTSEGMETALKRLQAETDWKPENGKAWAMKALVYGNAVDFMGMAPDDARENAKLALEKALELARHSNLTHAAYGLVRGYEDFEGVERRLKHCFETDPTFAECHNLYGDLLRKTGRAEQAGDIYLEGLERWPENGELHVSYALYLQETGEPQAAIEWLRKLVSDQPNFPRAHWHLAVMLYEEGGDLDEAREHAVKALEMDSKIWNGERLLLEFDRLR